MDDNHAEGELLTAEEVGAPVGSTSDCCCCWSRLGREATRRTLREGGREEEDERDETLKVNSDEPAGLIA